MASLAIISLLKLKTLSVFGRFVYLLFEVAAIKVKCSNCVYSAQVNVLYAIVGDDLVGDTQLVQRRGYDEAADNVILRNQFQLSAC
jgi:hypothetical protein